MAPPSRLGPILAICGVLVVVVVGIVPAGGVSAPAPERKAAAQAGIDADQVFMRVSLGQNGDAQWAIEYRVLLSTQNETAAFEALAEDVRTNTSTYLDRFGSGVNATVVEAENATGREMAVRNLSVRTATQQFGRYGVITYTFTWTNFAAVDGDRIRAGDALAGLFLDSSTALRFEWPADYTAETVRPEANDRGDNYVVWNGERSFGAGEPRVVVTPAGTGPGLLSDLLPVALVGVAIIGILILGGWVIYRRRGGESTPPEEDSTPTAAVTDESSETKETPDELLSNEERVLRLLEENGGRIKQQRVVEELDWTAAKTSQVVNGMRDEGDIEVFRLGRENVLRLPEEGPLEENEEESA